MIHLHDPNVEALPLTDRPLLFDGCPECERRAKDPLTALLHMDGDHLQAAWNRMLAVEMNTGPWQPVNTGYLSGCEKRVCHALYRLFVLLQRNPGTLRVEAATQPREEAL